MTPESSTGIISINWDNLWLDQSKSTAFTGEGVEYWNLMADRFRRRQTNYDSYVREVLSRLRVSSRTNILDAGCGSGSLTIPLSRYVRQITALDYSPAMLDILKQNLGNEAISNVHVKNADFLKTPVSEIGQFDTVVLSRSLPLRHLRESLTRISELSLNQCYLTWKAGKEDNKARICDIAGLDYHAYPDYLIIVNMLYTMGISANVEIFQSVTEFHYKSIDDAIRNSIGNHQPEEAAYQNLKSYFKNQLSFKDDIWHDKQINTWALIWWEKQNLE